MMSRSGMVRWVNERGRSSTGRERNCVPRQGWIRILAGSLVMILLCLPSCDLATMAGRGGSRSSKLLPPFAASSSEPCQSSARRHGEHSPSASSCVHSATRQVQALDVEGRRMIQMRLELRGGADEEMDEETLKSILDETAELARLLQSKDFGYDDGEEVEEEEGGGKSSRGVRGVGSQTNAGSLGDQDEDGRGLTPYQGRYMSDMVLPLLTDATKDVAEAMYVTLPPIPPLIAMDSTTSTLIPLSPSLTLPSLTTLRATPMYSLSRSLSPQF